MAGTIRVPAGSDSLFIHEALLMPTTLRIAVQSVFVGVCLAMCLPAAAQQPNAPPPAGDDASESWYRNNTEQQEYQPNPRAIIHEKAMARSKQRQARLEAINWYHMPSSRPTVSVLFGSPYFPASTLPMPGRRPWVEQNSVIVGEGNTYTPVWQQNGRRPYAWYSSGVPSRDYAR
jgi:hypothetical protein